ncbi:hypothetical protein SDJN02_16493 [Cucurbita argyrosperma subsp. argyrosperma]|nr:hypothetical protein SDJN02_16493 [Cucurbita argyrosperma subsp. argyrosperma]
MVCIMVSQTSHMLRYSMMGVGAMLFFRFGVCFLLFWVLSWAVVGLVPLYGPALAVLMDYADYFPKNGPWWFLHTVMSRIPRFKHPHSSLLYSFRSS